MKPKHVPETGKLYLRHASAILFHFAGFRKDDPAKALMFCRVTTIFREYLFPPRNRRSYISAPFAISGFPSKPSIHFELP